MKNQLYTGTYKKTGKRTFELHTTLLSIYNFKTKTGAKHESKDMNKWFKARTTE